jgi:glycosyltransferase involved in cell wall biosynthesis
MTDVPTVAVVGLSIRTTCGVHDHADVLAAELAAEGVRCTRHWLVRTHSSLGRARAEVNAWSRTLVADLQAERPDAILLHYSVFSYSHKGVPLFVHPVLAALRRTGIPVVGVLHEFAYPWNYGGPRGLVWAVTQRAILIDLIRACSSVIVTTDWRASWLRSRRWLPRRPVLMAPVFSNLPPPSPGAPRHTPGPVIGLFGYSYQGAALSLVLDAVRQVRAAHPGARLLLLGAPGPDSPAARAWTQAGAERGLTEAISFSGALPAQEISDAIAGCDVLLFVDTAGPSPRKGTLAGSLSSGRPVLALDGKHTWPELQRARAARVVAPTAGALASALAELLADPHELDALGVRGRAFAEREMGVRSTAEAVRSLLRT